MATTSSARRSSSGPVIRSLSPSGRFCSRSSSAFSFHRSASPTRLNLYSSPPSAPSVRFSIDHRPASPGRTVAAVSSCGQVLRKPSSNLISAPAKKTCMCSPTNHPGSFRCSLHKGFGAAGSGAHQAVSSRLNARRSAMTNSLVRIGTVEGDWVKRALKALIRPSSHQQRRRAAFQPRPSRLSVMSKADD